MPDRSFTLKRTDQPIGLMALIQELNLPVRRPTVSIRIRSGARKTIITREAIKEYYPPVYAPSRIIGNLKLPYVRTIDLSVYEALFKVLDSWNASLNRFRPTSTTRCVTNRLSSIITLRTYIDSGTQPWF